MNETNLKDHLVVLSYADIGARTGLGSSGSFTVGLLNSLYGYLGKTIEKEELAELACHIQMNSLNQPSGKQDEYIATFGGIQCFDIAKNGKVSVNPLKISENSTEDNLTYASINKFFPTANSVDQSISKVILLVILLNLTVCSG